MGGLWGCADMRLFGWRKAYKNCLGLPISTIRIFFLVAHSKKKTPQLSVLDLEQFWDGWPYEKFYRKCASEDKTRWKDSCWFVVSVYNPKSCLDVTSGIRANLSSKISGTNQAEAGGHVTPEADETREWPPVHKTCQWVAPDIF